MLPRPPRVGVLSRKGLLFHPSPQAAPPPGQKVSSRRGHAGPPPSRTPIGLTVGRAPGRFYKVAPRPGPGLRIPARVRLILENSTVCLIVDELVCFAPRSIVSVACPCLGGLWGGLVLVSLTMILALFFVSDCL